MTVILPDTNVVSELIYPAPGQDVLVWMDERSTRQLLVTAITDAEVRTGVANLPVDARRQGLADAAERMVGCVVTLHRLLPPAR